MKITSPLFAESARGELFGLGYFSGPAGSTRFTSYALAPRARTRGNARVHQSFAAALVRWQTRPYAAAIPWRYFAALQLTLAPALSQVFTATRQATQIDAATATLPQHLIEPN